MARGAESDLEGYRPFVELPPEDIDRLLAIHCSAVARLTRAALLGMVERGCGGTAGRSSSCTRGS